MSESPDQLQPVATPFKNRRGWLIAFGVVQILIAAMIFLMAIAIMFIPTADIEKAQPQGAMPFPMAIISVFYGLLGGLFALLGIGSILVKNWARIGTLIASWFWLGIGVFGVLFTAFLMPTILRNSPHPTNVPDNVNSLVMTFAVIFQSLFFIVLPGIFLLFYHSKNVRATFMSGQPDSSSARPILMTILMWWFGFGAVSVLLAAFLLSKYPAVLFGVAVAGWPGRLIFVGSALADGIAMWGYMKRDVRGWWVAMGASLFWAASAIVTHLRGTLPELYSKMGMTQEQLAMFSTPQFQVIGIVASVVFLAVRIGAIAYSKRYFDAPSEVVPETV